MPISAIFFMLAFLVVWALAFIRHPIYGVYGYLMAFYVFPPARWWGDYLPDLRWSLSSALIMLLAYLAYNAKQKKAPQETQEINRYFFKSGPVILLIILTIWLWIQNAWALSAELHLGVSILFTKYLILFYVIYRIMNTEELIYRFAFAHVLGCAYYGWVAYSTVVGGRFENVGSPGINDANLFATHMITGLVTAGFLLFRASNNKERAVLVLCIPFILNAIILTQSRGAFLGLACAGLLAIFLKPKQYRKAFYMLALGGVLAVAMLAHEAFWSRMQTISKGAGEEQTDKSARSRLVIIEAQGKMFLESPILGHGHRGTASLSPYFMDKRWLTRGSGDQAETGARSSHNTFMTLLVEQGIPGAIMYFALVWWTAKNLNRFRKREGSVSPKYLIYNALVGCSLVGLLIAGQFADYFKHEVQIWMYAILLASYRLADKEAEEKGSAEPTAAPPTKG